MNDLNNAVIAVDNNSTAITTPFLNQRHLPNTISSSTKPDVNLTRKARLLGFPGQEVPGATKDSKIKQNKLAYPKFVDNSTEYEYENIYVGNIYSEIEALFIAGKQEYFEDGVESKFSRGLVSCIQKYGDKAIEAITCVILYERVNPEVASEALRWLGEINHPESYKFRLWLLERSLSISSSKVRDGAILGLSYLNDPHAIHYLEQAIEQEKIIELRDDMKQVLSQLKREI